MDTQLNQKRFEPGILMLENKEWAKKMRPLTHLTIFCQNILLFFFNNQEKMCFLPFQFFTHKCADRVEIYDFFYCEASLNQR